MLLYWVCLPLQKAVYNLDFIWRQHQPRILLVEPLAKFKTHRADVFISLAFLVLLVLESQLSAVSWEKVSQSALRLGDVCF